MAVDSNQPAATGAVSPPPLPAAPVQAQPKPIPAAQAAITTTPQPPPPPASSPPPPPNNKPVATQPPLQATHLKPREAAAAAPQAPAPAPQSRIPVDLQTQIRKGQRVHFKEDENHQTRNRSAGDDTLALLQAKEIKKVTNKCRCDSAILILALVILGASLFGRTSNGLNTLFLGSRPFAIGTLCVGIIATLCASRRLCKSYPNYSKLPSRV